MQTSAAAVESSMELPHKIENGSAFWPSHSTSGNISKGIQNTDLKEYLHPYVHRSIIYNNQDIEATRCPSIDEWINMEYYSAIKNEILPFVTIWVDPVGIMLNEVSQSEKEKYCIISLSCEIMKNNEQSKIGPNS